ncbi:hypothetical protein [Cryptosporangium minutisporangium]|uniref:Uncharacterized protein n=1 Tax=Cryptosporangium minutisporangium TaxID=113569 RepID=A0ABP6STA5_9ACTN
MEDWGAGALLRDLVAEEPPPSRVDPRRAITGAKRRRQRRRAGLLVAGVLAVAVGVVAGILPVIRSTPAPVATAAPEQQQNQNPPFRFDPTRFQLALGWRPDGVTRVETESDRAYQRITLLRTEKDEQGKSQFLPIATIEVYGTGQVLPDDRVPAQTTAPIYADGAASHWIPGRVGQPDRSGRLLWFWAPNAWAFLTVYDSSEPIDLALQLARTLRTDQDTTVRMAFTVQAPAGLAHAHTATAWGPDGVYAAELTFAPRGQWLYDRWIAVSATNDSESVSTNRPYVFRGTVLTGDRRSNLASDPPIVLRPTGQDLVAAASVILVPEAKPVLDPAATQQVARSVRLVDGPDDKANWTTSFLR